MNPYDTPAAQQARLRMYEHLATHGTGPLADFAKEVVAGRRRPADVLKENWILEQDVDALSAEIDRFHALPEEERTVTYDEAMAQLEALFARINAAEDTTPEPRSRPSDDNGDDERGPFLSDAW
ncbi:hypothetical protein ACIA8G_08885 [Lentzea sp. NPDC051213]|uniref:hypothetical protein n=1 Tax=Lentzea sp. NPDC051213 TaxID=3364126 RepID=UPI0037B7450D